MAAAFAARHEIADFRTSSAGTRAVIGHPIHREAALVLESLGGEASDFAARQLTPKIVSAADLVVTMTRAHRDKVLEIAPSMLKRTFTLGEAACLATEFQLERVTDLADLRPQLDSAKAVDIPDPIGQSSEIFAEVGDQISGMLLPTLELCRRLA